MTMKLMAVTRLSTQAQRSGHGRERQEQLEIRVFAKELGGEIVHTRELIEGATVFDRPQFEALLREAIDLKRAGEIDGLIFGSVERLSRDVFDGSAYCRDSLKLGLRLFFAAERLDVSEETHQTQIVGALQAGRAYAKRLRMQTIPARRARAKDGKLPNGQHRWPFDYNRETGRATPNPTKGALVRRWVQILQAGQSIGDCCRLMMREGILAPKGGVTWSRSTITRILKDPAIKGEFYHGYERMEEKSYHEASVRRKATPERVYVDKDNAILSDEEWEWVQQRLFENIGKSRRNTKIDYTPLHRLILCHCGRKAGAYPLHGKPYFRCAVCKRPLANAVKLWHQVKNGLSLLLTNPDRLGLMIRSQLEGDGVKEGLKKRKDALIAELKDHSGALERAGRAFIIMSGYTEEMAEKEAKKIEARIRAVKQELSDVTQTLGRLTGLELGKDQILAMCDRFPGVIDEASAEEWHALLMDFGVSVVLQPKAPHLVKSRVKFELTPQERALLQPSTSWVCQTLPFRKPGNG